jgi:hypothetical protein
MGFAVLSDHSAKLDWSPPVSVLPSPLGYAGLRREGSTAVPVSPPTLSVLRFLYRRDGREPLNKVGPSKQQAVFESYEVRDLSPWDGIFPQSFILVRFSIVEESGGSMGQLEIKTRFRFESLLEEREYLTLTTLRLLAAPSTNVFAF